MLKIFLQLILYAHTIFGEVIHDFPAKPETSKIEGLVLKTAKGDEYFSFRGIPYAKPPVGELRFKDPQPLEEHPYFIDAKFDGHKCPSTFAKNASEDCLTIDVYTKSVDTSAQLPVLVVVDDGKLRGGPSLSSNVKVEYLMSKSMVAVTFNYRQGPLGFMSLGSEIAPGNAGLKDQVLALRWVQNYIKYFGGNSSNVMLMGYSSKSYGTGLHLMSPMSRGLFHKAALMAPVLRPLDLTKHEQLKMAEILAKELGCIEANMPRLKNARELLDCFNKFNSSKIVKTASKWRSSNKNSSLYLYSPVIEHDFGQERFLTKPTSESIKRGDFMHVPITLGFIDVELCQYAIDIITNYTLYDDFEKLGKEMFKHHQLPNEKQLDFMRHIAHLLKNDNALHCGSFCQVFSALNGYMRTSKLPNNYLGNLDYPFKFIRQKKYKTICSDSGDRDEMIEITEAITNTLFDDLYRCMVDE